MGEITLFWMLTLFWQVMNGPCLHSMQRLFTIPTPNLFYSLSLSLSLHHFSPRYALAPLLFCTNFLTLLKVWVSRLDGWVYLANAFDMLNFDLGCQILTLLALTSNVIFLTHLTTDIIATFHRTQVFFRLILLSDFWPSKQALVSFCLIFMNSRFKSIRDQEA